MLRESHLDDVRARSPERTGMLAESTLKGENADPGLSLHEEECRSGLAHPPNEGATTLSQP